MFNNTIAGEITISLKCFNFCATFSSEKGRKILIILNDASLDVGEETRGKNVTPRKIYIQID